MTVLNRLNDAPHTPLKLIAGIVVGGVGVAVLFRTDTSTGSLSVLGIGLSFLFGFVASLADHIEPLRRVFERGQWLIFGIAVLFLLAAVQNYVTLSLLTGLALGLSSGVLLSTVASSSVNCCPSDDGDNRT